MTGPQSSNRVRGDCAICGRSFLLKQDGTLRVHWTDRLECEGSGLFPACDHGSHEFVFEGTFQRCFRCGATYASDPIPNRVPTPAEALCGAADLNGKLCIRSRGHSGSHWSKHGEPWYFDTPADATRNRVRAERVAESVYNRSPIRDKDSDRLLEWHEIGPLLREALIEQAQVYIEVTRYV